MKTETRKIAEKIQAITGESLISINYKASLFVSAGLAANQLDALNEILSML
jgi:flavodoxin